LVERDAPRVADLAREISQIEDALRGSSEPPKRLRPETWGVLLDGDFAASGIIRTALPDGAGGLQRGAMCGTIGAGSARPEFGPFDDQPVWADDIAGSVGDLGIAVRRAPYDPKGFAAFAIERRPDVCGVVKFWLKHACGTLVTDDIRLRTAVAAAKREGTAALLADALAILRQALLCRQSEREQPRGVGPKRIFAEPTHAFWLAQCGVALMWPDAAQKPTRRQIKAMARIMLETDLLFRQAINERASEPPPFQSSRVAWILNQRCTAELLQTVINQLWKSAADKLKKQRKTSGADQRKTSDVNRRRTPRVDQLLRGCEIWLAELIERLRRGGHEQRGTGARTRRGRWKIPPPLEVGERGVLAAIKAALRRAGMVAKRRV
jgi:hypothetical protein